MSYAEELSRRFGHGFGFVLELSEPLDLIHLIRAKIDCDAHTVWSGADALGEVAVRTENLEETAGGDRDSVGKDDEIQSAGVFGGGVFDSGNAA